MSLIGVVAEVTADLGWPEIVLALGLALGPAAVTGFVAYQTGRRSTEVELARIEAENERLREQHREDHLRNRQGTYHRLLNALQKLGRSSLSNRPRHFTEVDYKAVVEEVSDLIAGAILFGTPEVRTRADVLARELVSLNSALDHERMTSASFAEAVDTAWRLSGGGFNTAGAALVEAMRADVAPS